MLNKAFQSNQRGFTLMEVLAASFVLTIGVVGVLTMINQTTAFTQITSSKLTATYLAQEGIEIVKNIRDTNLLKIHKGIPDVNWFDGLTNCASGCEADYKTMSLSPYGGGNYLNIDQDRFYSYSPPLLLSPFKRKITIFDTTDLDDPPDGIIDKMKVSVEVSWAERGRSHQVTVQEHLYKWWQ